MKKLIIALTLMASASLVGCAGQPSKAYDGAARDIRELSVFKATARFTSGSAQITIFDGRGDTFGRPYRPLTNQNEIHALPGRHTMTVRVSDSARMGEYNGWEKISIDSEAGRTYLVHGELEVLQFNPPKGRVLVWITIEGSDRVVAGTPPAQK